MSDDSDADGGASREIEHNGHAVKVSTPFYDVEVYGEPTDDLDDVKEAAEDVADKARDDVESLDSRLSAGANSHYE